MEERVIRDEEVVDILWLEMRMSKPPLRLSSGFFYLTASKIMKGHAYIYK